MRCGSLFSGIGGMDHGLAKAGFTHEFFCESDPWRREILARHWPGVPIYEDVVRVGEPAGGGTPDGLREAADDGGREAGSWLPDDLALLCGGFPCQDVSVAGRRAGLAGERSGLFHEFARIVDAVRPRFILVENVPGLLSSNGGRDFGVVLGTLVELGYGLGWRILDSRYFGVPQRRRRVFIVGARADGDPRGAAERAGQVLAVGSRCDRHPPSGTAAGPNAAVASLSGLGTGGPDDNDGQGGRLVAASLTGGNTSYGPRGGASRLDDHDVHGNHLVTAFHVTQDPISGDIAPAMSKGNRQGTGTIGVGTSAGVRRLTVTECERLQSLPDGWTLPGPDSRRYAALGDAVTSSVAEWIGRRIKGAS